VHFLSGWIWKTITHAISRSPLYLWLPAKKLVSSGKQSGLQRQMYVRKAGSTRERCYRPVAPQVPTIGWYIILISSPRCNFRVGSIKNKIVSPPECNNGWSKTECRRRGLRRFSFLCIGESGVGFYFVLQITDSRRALSFAVHQILVNIISGEAADVYSINSSPSNGSGPYVTKSKIGQTYPESQPRLFSLQTAIFSKSFSGNCTDSLKRKSPVIYLFPIPKPLKEHRGCWYTSWEYSEPEEEFSIGGFSIDKWFVSQQALSRWNSSIEQFEI